jgi:hypothetical protein
MSTPNGKPMIRHAYKTALLGLAAVIIEAVYPKFPFLFFGLYFGLCWVLWLVCAWQRGSSIMALVGLWILIDSAVLIELVAFERTYGHGSLSGGEFLYLFSFAPVIIPSGLLLRVTGHIVSEWSLWAELGPAASYVVPQWIDLSVFAVLQSLAVAVVGRFLRPARLLSSQ